MITRKTFLITLIACFTALFLPTQAAEALSETAKINALISHVETLQDATFIRNGSDYSAKNAAKFLRGKWDANKNEIATAKDFIEKAATKSSTTGKPYLIKLKDSGETPCADYLTTQLIKIEAGK